MAWKNKIRNLAPESLLSAAKKSIYHFHSFSEKLLNNYFDKYDYETIKVIEIVLKPTDNWIDVGAHKGLITKELLRKAPRGKGFAFEPLPHLFKKLQSAYGKKINVYDTALADVAGEAEFNYYADRPAVSGFKKRNFNDANDAQSIKVKVDTLENIIPTELEISLIKIDVEGAELGVLKGAERILKQSKPVILFEFGLGGADLYNTTPEMIFDFLESCGLSLSTQQLFLNQKEAFSRKEFIGNYNKGYDYFFIAYDKNKSDTYFQK